MERLRSELNLRGDGIVVAVLDTGIDYNHPALGGGLGPSHTVVRTSTGKTIELSTPPRTTGPQRRMAVSITVQPAQFTLEAGASRDVVMSADVDSGVAVSAMTMGFGGRVDFESAGAVAVRVPWAGLRAARSVVNYDGVFPSIMWSCSPGPNAFFGHNRPDGYETLLPYGACSG